MSKVYNPETGRMVLITGVKGKEFPDNFKIQIL